MADEPLFIRVAKGLPQAARQVFGGMGGQIVQGAKTIPAIAQALAAAPFNAEDSFRNIPERARSVFTNTPVRQDRLAQPRSLPLIGEINSYDRRVGQYENEPGYTPLLAATRAASEGVLDVAALGQGAGITQRFMTPQAKLRIGGKTLTLKDVHSAEGTRFFETLTPAEQAKYTQFDQVQSRLANPEMYGLAKNGETNVGPAINAFLKTSMKNFKDSGGGLSIKRVGTKPSQGSDLTTEARKYETAEEFVEGQTLWHGTSPEGFSKIKTEGFKRPSELPKGLTNTSDTNAALSDAIFATPNKSFAEKFGKDLVKIDKSKLNIQDGWGEFKGGSVSELKVAIQKLVDEGVDAIRLGKGFSEEIKIINPAKIKLLDESQLTDIWNKANVPAVYKGETNDKSLLAVHNLTEQKLKFADRIGGLPNPSMAVIDPRKNAFESYGDITLVADKNILRGQNTHLADAYSPRFPTVHTSMDYKDFDALQASLKPYYDKIGKDARIMYRDDTLMLQKIENNPAVALRFLESKGVKPSKEGQHYYHSQITEDPILTAEFNDHLDEIYKQYNLQEQMFAGYTPSGQRRYRPVTLEGASKIMGKQKEEGFNYGLGSFRSKIAPIKKTPEAIKKEQGRLVTKEQFDVIKEQHDSELFALRDELEPFAKIHDSSNRFIESDSQINAIGGVLSGERDAMRWFDSEFPNAPQELKDKVIAFREKLKEMPTEYFETKFKRPVTLNEFRIAVVPDTTAEATIKLLESKGLRILKYAKGEKQKVMDSLLLHPEAFGIGVLPTFLPSGQTSQSTPQKSDRILKGPSQELFINNK